MDDTTTTTAGPAMNPPSPGSDLRANPPEGWASTFAALRERIERLEADVRQLQGQIANRA